MPNLRAPLSTHENSTSLVFSEYSVRKMQPRGAVVQSLARCCARRALKSVRESSLTARDFDGPAQLRTKTGVKSSLTARPCRNRAQLGTIWGFTRRGLRGWAAELAWGAGFAQGLGLHGEACTGVAELRPQGVVQGAAFRWGGVCAGGGGGGDACGCAVADCPVNRGVRQQAATRRHPRYVQSRDA